MSQWRRGWRIDDASRLSVRENNPDKTRSSASDTGRRDMRDLDRRASS